MPSATLPEHVLQGKLGASKVQALPLFAETIHTKQKRQGAVNTSGGSLAMAAERGWLGLAEGREGSLDG
jgi:hypothetical protein